MKTVTPRALLLDSRSTLLLLHTFARHSTASKSSRCNTSARWRMPSLRSRLLVSEFRALTSSQRSRRLEYAPPAEKDRRISSRWFASVAPSGCSIVLPPEMPSMTLEHR